MPRQGPPLCLLESGSHRPPPDARQGYPSCVVPAVRNGPPPYPDRKRGAAGGSADTKSPQVSSKNGDCTSGPGFNYHQMVPQRSRALALLPELDRQYHPVLGGFQHYPEEEVVPTRLLACCLCGVLVAAALLYLLYSYVKEQTEFQSPHVDVGNVEFVNQVFAHRVADIIRTATASSSAATSQYAAFWRSGLTGLGFTAGPPLARILGSKVVRGGVQDSALWVSGGQGVGLDSSRAGSRREMAVVDLDKEEMVVEGGAHVGRLKSSSSSPSSLLKTSALSFGDQGDAEDVGVLGSAFRQVCELYPRHLVGNVSGDVDHEHKTLTLSQVRAQHGVDLAPGGEWRPPDCLARYRLAVIIPYRDRLAHLTVLLAHLLPILKRQQLHFRIFVVEQFGNLTFNKGRIMNAAFKEALKMYDFQCVVFHDVDLIPEDDRNMYSCPIMPRHMSVAINEMNYKLLYNLLVGGVLNLRVEHYQQVNGYSNMYWGWGGEDDDMAYRILHEKLKIIRPPVNIARYQMIKHTKRKPTSWNIRSRLLRTAVKRYHLDGLNSVQYTIQFIHQDPLYTHIMVDIGKPDMRL